MAEEKNDGSYGIPRKLWVALANDQLARRKRYLGAEFAKSCNGCIEILMCDGPIGKHLCQTIDNMVKDGLLSAPKKIPINKRRQRLLPISRACLEAYDLFKKAGGS